MANMFNNTDLCLKWLIDEIFSPKFYLVQNSHSEDCVSPAVPTCQGYCLTCFITFTFGWTRFNHEYNILFFYNNIKKKNGSRC